MEPMATVEEKKKRSGVGRKSLRRVLPVVPSDLRGVSKAKGSHGLALKVQGQGVQRRYDEGLKRDIALMATQRGNKKTAEHYRKKLGFHMYTQTVCRFKKEYLGNGNKKRGLGKGQVGEVREEQAGGSEEQVEGGEENVQVSAVGGSTSIQERSLNDTTSVMNEEGVSNQEDGGRVHRQVENAKREVDSEHNSQQVKEQRGERDGDVSVMFDLCR